MNARKSSTITYDFIKILRASSGEKTSLSLEARLCPTGSREAHANRWDEFIGFAMAEAAPIFRPIWRVSRTPRCPKNNQFKADIKDRAAAEGYLVSSSAKKIYFEEHSSPLQASKVISQLLSRKYLRKVNGALTDAPSPTDGPRLDSERYLAGTYSASAKRRPGRPRGPSVEFAGSRIAIHGRSLEPCRGWTGICRQTTLNPAFDALTVTHPMPMTNFARSHVFGP